MTKNEARLIAGARVGAMCDAEREWASGAIADALSSLDAFRKAGSVFCYFSVPGEPDTEELIGLMLALEKTVSVPRVRGEDMDAVIVTPFTDFRRNKWGIYEPVRGRIAEEFDLIIVPVVAFDGLMRVGHGKGYYDRFLKTHSAVTVGLAFSAQKVEGAEFAPHDVALDMLLTEKEIIKGNGSEANPFGGAM